MVVIASVKEHIARFTSQHHMGRVCVFSGATSGIGFGTIQKMLYMLHSSTFYILGRSQSKFATRLEELRALSPSCKIVFIECQVSLLSDMDSACEQIASAEDKVDCLCMSQGGMPFRGATCMCRLVFRATTFDNHQELISKIDTDEGLELSMSLWYYCRLRLVSNLLPLLRQSAQPRVLSIMNATREVHIDEHDLGLDRRWTIVGSMNHTTMCNDLAFDYLAASDSGKQITFIHDTPGWVKTGTPRTEEHRPRMKDGFFWWAFVSLVQIVTGWWMQNRGMSLEESSERHAFYLTSDSYKPGSWQANRLNEVVPANSALKYYQERGWAEKVWEHTLRVWERALAKGAAS